MLLQILVILMVIVQGEFKYFSHNIDLNLKGGVTELSLMDSIIDELAEQAAPIGRLLDEDMENFNGTCLT